MADEWTAADEEALESAPPEKYPPGDVPPDVRFVWRDAKEIVVTNEGPRSEPLDDSASTA